ncbi:MAG: radical SAM protein [bacterium]|nr:radical SAM protein [bacterium]
MKNCNIPIFIPHLGCPFECVFCNQRRITGRGTDVTPEEAVKIIEGELATLPHDAHIEAAFFGGSFTGIPMKEQNALMDAVQPYIEEGRIQGIRLSTRPDYITKEILDNLLKHHVTTIELGVQSLDDEVLKAACRGHNAVQVHKAVSLIKEYSFTLGLQMMTGLPGDTPEKSMYTAQEIVKLKPDIARIYPTLTIKDTFLEKMYYEGKYRPQTLDEAVELAKRILLLFEENDIRVIRLGLQSTGEISENGAVTAGPVHSSFGELVESSIYLDIMREKLPDNSSVRVFVNPREISKASGNRRRNIKALRNEKNTSVKISGDENLKKREVRFVVS